MKGTVCVPIKNVEFHEIDKMYVRNVSRLPSLCAPSWLLDNQNNHLIKLGATWKHMMPFATVEWKVRMQLIHINSQLSAKVHYILFWEKSWYQISHHLSSVPIGHAIFMFKTVDVFLLTCEDVANALVI